MKLKFLIGALLCSALSFAQEQLVKLDAEEIFEKAAQLIQQDKIKDLITELERIPKSDSLYCSALASRSYYHLALEEMDKVIETVNEGLQNEYCAEESLVFYINKSVAFLNTDRISEAETTLKEGLKKFPTSPKIWYNLGLVYEGQDKLKEAIAAYDTTIMLDPFYEKPHLRLGNISYQAGQMSRALMSFNMYLLIMAADGGDDSVVRALNDFYSRSNPNVSAEVDMGEDSNGTYRELDMILDQGLVLNDGYQTPSQIDEALVRQSHLLLAQLDKMEDTEGLWSGKYQALYKYINQNEEFDDFILAMYYGSSDPDHQKLIEKKKKDLQEFYDRFQQKWAALVSVNTQTEQPYKSYYYNGDYVSAIGVRDGEKFIGDWKFYDDGGRLSATGSFDNNGERDGTWVWFHPNGEKKEAAQYKQGVLDGPNTYWFENGTKKVEASYTDGELQGPYTTYRSTGALYQKVNYVKGKKQGEYVSYFPVGEQLPEFEAVYTDDKLSGTLVEYYSNGAVYLETPYVDGVPSGVERKYYPQQSLSAETTYLNGKVEGPYTFYYPDGAKKETGSYKNDQLHGEIKQYYPDGTVEGHYQYAEGQLEGVSKNYDYDGKLLYEYTYRRGEVIAYKFYDKSGGVLREDRKKGGEFYYYSYSHFGKVNSEGLYDISGGKKGLWKFYSDHGVLTEATSFENNEPIGESLLYYLDGTLKTKSNFVDGKLEGYCVNYYNNGNMESQGYYKEGEAHGKWLFYYSNGVVKEESFYHKGQPHGDQKRYDAKGRLAMVYNYKFGEFLSETRYLPDGTVFETVDRSAKPGKYVDQYQHFNGKPQFKFEILYGVKHGKASELGFEGNKLFEGQYVNGKQNGPWVYYHPNGQVEIECEYLLGDLHGELILYYDNGAVSTKYTSVNGERSGIDIDYFRDGKLDTQINYVNGKKEGRMEFYSPDGQFQLVRFYRFGRLLGYSHLDENGQELPMIPIENETAKFTTYYDNGKPSRQMEYLNGQLVNEYKTFYYSGAPHEDINYRNNEYDGKYLEYFANGNLKKSFNYQYGAKNGVQKEYYENGKLKSEIEYVDDEKMGYAKYYDENGTLNKEETYFNGIIFDVKKP